MRLSRSELNQRVLYALSCSTVWHGELSSKPFEFDIGLHQSQRYRAYIYNATFPAGGRALGERKIQLKLPGQATKERENFDHSDNRMPLLIGYDQETEIFILWDAGTYRNFPFNMNVQVAPETIFSAFANGIAIQTRTRRIPLPVEEVVICTTSKFLSEAISLRVTKSLERITEDC